MRFSLLTLADFALAHADGKLYITGGGIHLLQFPTFPAVHPHLSLAVDIQLEPTDLGRAHTVNIRGLTPSGESFGTPATLSIPLSPTTQFSEGHVQFVYNMDRLTFPSEGAYTFVLDIDGTESSELRLRVRQETGVLAPAIHMAQLFQSGYEAFERGDLMAAEQYFRQVMETAPSLAAVHNNLGFVYLAKGTIEDALASFGRARELGFDRRELLDANVACCYYLLGNYESALSLFQGRLRTSNFVGPAMLFGVCQSELFLVQLPAAPAYVALMALNAAWTATRAGRADLGASFLGIATAMERTIGLGEDFLESIQTLTRELTSHRD